jgi:CBS domain-containing protein
LLAIKLHYARATRIAASVGQGMALLFGFFGLFFNPFLVFIALFVWMGAEQEASMVEMKSTLGGVPVGRVMMTRFRTLSPQDPLSQAVQQILAGSQQDFPVVEGRDVVGVLTRTSLLAGLTKGGEGATVGQFMEREFRTAQPGDTAEQVVARLQDCACRVLPVVQDGELLGLVNMENVGEYMMIQSALQREPPKITPYDSPMTHRHAA